MYFKSYWNRLGNLHKLVRAAQRSRLRREKTIFHVLNLYLTMPHVFVETSSYTWSLSKVFLYYNFLVSPHSDSWNVSQTRPRNWWFLVPEKEVVSTRWQILRGCRWAVLNHLSFIANVAFRTEWCRSRPAQIFDATIFSSHIGKRIDGCAECTYRNCNGPLTILLHRQRLWRIIYT